MRGMIGFSWGAFLVYLAALTTVVGGGLWGLIQTGHPVFLAPTLLGLFFFYLCWEAVVETNGTLPPPNKGNN